VRSRFIVAIAALIAASALVAGPENTGAQQVGGAQSPDPAQFRAFTIVLPSGSPATSISTLDQAQRSAGWLEPDTTLVETLEIEPTFTARPAARQPVVTATSVAKATPVAKVAAVATSPWHLDPNISWYGPGMYGKRTACGVLLTTTVMGVASRTLACGVRVTFRNPANGRTVTVPVIDRGPYVSGRIWDMSGGLCTYLRHCYTGAMLWRLASS
jgi:hypothetical protein